MRRIKKQEKQQQRSFFDSKVNVAVLCAAIGVILILSIIFMIIEGSYGSTKIKNQTDLTLEYVTVNFVSYDGPVNEGFSTGQMEAGKSYTADSEEINLTGAEANLELRIKFENQEEILNDVGYFNGKFNGNIKINFEKTDDPNIVKVKVKAGNGVFNTNLIDCNEEFLIDLNEGIALE